MKQKFTVLTLNTFGDGGRIFGFRIFDIFFSHIKVDKVLKKFSPDIVCFQEMNSFYEKYLKHSKIAKKYPYIFVPKGNENQSKRINNNVILSKFRILETGEIPFPILGKWKTIPEHTSFSKIRIGTEDLNIYNCHFAIKDVGPKHRIIQLETILKDCAKRKGPVVICGDLNITITESGFCRKLIQFFHRELRSSLFCEGKYLKEAEKYYFSKLAEVNGFKDVDEELNPTWRIYGTNWEAFKIKLDWMLYKNLIKKQHTLGEYETDHRPIFAEFEI